jgi:predicted N-acetyltransferase YhbS
MRIFKRLLIVLVLLLLGAAILSGVAWHYLRGVPAYYRTFKWNKEERTALNQSAVAKFTRTRNQAAAAWSAEVQSASAGTTRRWTSR